jgi:HK97 gp10 family phage protein
MAGFGRTFEVMAQIRRINKQLNDVAAKCEGPVGDTLLTQASLVASEIRSVAPVDDHSPTPGALKASVRVEQGSPTPKKSIVVKIKAGGRGTDESGYDYARANEFGTQKMPAQPFFFPIWRARRKDVRAVIRKKIKIAVKDVFK